MSAQFEASRWQRILARHGVCTIYTVRYPSDKIPLQTRAFHWCPACESYQSSNILDPDSHSARIHCTNCGIETTLIPKGNTGGFAHQLQMAFQAMDSSNIFLMKIMKFWRVILFGPSWKSMPDHRHGQTATEMNERATMEIGPLIVESLIPGSLDRALRAR
ncbi:MAG: hypothetical protein AAB738_02090 [Patescibacteria group bacterium]